MTEAKGRESAGDGGRDDAPKGLVERCEEVFFALLVGAFLLAGLLPIVSRYIEMAGFSWPPTLSKQLVIWVALFGAGAATRDRKHISIDAVGHLLPERVRLGLRALTELFAAAVCGVLVPVSISFVKGEIEFSGDPTSHLGVPRSWLQSIIPLGFALLALRLLVAAWFDARAACRSPQKGGAA